VETIPEGTEMANPLCLDMVEDVVIEGTGFREEHFTWSYVHLGDGVRIPTARSSGHH
jgi:hypothetical protein